MWILDQTRNSESLLVVCCVYSSSPGRAVISHELLDHAARRPSWDDISRWNNSSLCNSRLCPSKNAPMLYAEGLCAWIDCFQPKASTLPKPTSSRLRLICCWIASNQLALWLWVLKVWLWAPTYSDPLSTPQCCKLKTVKWRDNQNKCRGPTLTYKIMYSLNSNNRAFPIPCLETLYLIAVRAIFRAAEIWTNSQQGCCTYTANRLRSKP